MRTLYVQSNALIFAHSQLEQLSHVATVITYRYFLQIKNMNNI